MNSKFPQLEAGFRYEIARFFKYFKGGWRGYAIITLLRLLHLTVELENIHEYYSVVVAHGYLTDQTLSVVLQLPLTRDNEFFQVYDVYTYPIYMIKHVKDGTNGVYKIKSS